MAVNEVPFIPVLSIEAVEVSNSVSLWSVLILSSQQSVVSSVQDYSLFSERGIIT
jgi:hypothetical protein